MKSVYNPYRDLSRDELYSAANRLAGELMNPTGTRSQEERAALLALNADHLLPKLGRHVSDGKYTPEKPEGKVHAGGLGLLDTLVKAHAREQRQARYNIFMRATDVTLGGGVPYWMAFDVVGRDLYEAAMESEAGLLSALEQMQGIHEAR